MTCDKSHNGEHDPFDIGSTWSTCMAGPNKGHDAVQCSWCGEHGSRSWHEEYRQVKGRGPHAQRLVRVTDGYTWLAPRDAAEGEG